MSDGPFKFAWCGGTIQEQQTIVTNGTTHGGEVKQFNIVGDIGGPAGSQQIRYLASNEGLEIGALYTVEGPGITPGTFFLYDNTPLAAEDSINLNQPTGTYKSATFTVTQSVVIGQAVATMSQGSNVLLLGDIDLAPGVYAVSGTGIGQTTVPPPPDTGGTPTGGVSVLIVASAWMEYLGGGVGHMYIMAAQAHTTTGTDSFGQPTSRTTFSVGTQQVVAVATGDFPIEIAGMPTADAYRVSSIPGTVLGGLQPGSRYNISGNGIAPGSTFVAPDPGATEIMLDLPTTASNFGALITITGPRTPDTDFDPAIHNRFDEDVIGLEITHEEGNFASLTIDLKNPGTGLLATGRNLWCWLSWDQAWTPDGTAEPNLIPLFNGRLVGVPRLAASEIVQLTFLARPDDFNYQKQQLVDQLSEFPFYDPIWITQNATPDTVLETYSALWHIDRVSLALTTSDIVEGEDGTIEIDESQAFYENFSLSYGAPPLTSVTISATVGWTQQAEGLLDVTQNIVSAFHDAGSPYPMAFPRFGLHGGGGGLIACLCGDGLRTDWPKPGTNIGGGWSLTTRNDDSGVPLCYCNDASRTTQGGWIQPQYYSVNFSGQQPPPSQEGNTTDQSNVNVFTQPVGQWEARFPVNVYKIKMTLDYRANRRRTETLTAVLTADVQRELSDSSDQDTEDMSFTSEYVDTGVDIGGGVPIGTPAMRSYFQTDRGRMSYEYLLLAARAKLRARARSVDVTFAVKWTDALGLGIGLRNSVTLFDRRLPGGVCTGKVKSYKLSVADGTMFGEFTLGCTIGNGNPTVPVEGTDTYVEPDYAVQGYQTVSGGQVVLLDGELAYQPLDEFIVVDDGLDITNITAAKAVNECVVVNGLMTQLHSLKIFQGTVGPTFGDPVNTMRTLTTTVTLDMKPVAGSEFHASFYPALSQLALPMTIDLAAEAA